LLERLRFALRAHPKWFFFGCMVFGAGVCRLPFLYEPNGNLAVLPYLATWVLVGFVAGILFPERPWRWGVAIVLGPPILGLILDPNRGDGLLMQLVTLPLLLVMAVPIIAGAYCGRLVAKPQEQAPRPSAPNLPSPKQAALFISAYLACIVPIFFLPSADLVYAWTAVAAVFGILLTTRFGLRTLRTTVLAVSAVVAAFMTSVIYDSINGGANHNLLPFELWFIMVFAVTAAGASAFIGSRIQKRLQP
jgi:hypothetical protein